MRFFAITSLLTLSLFVISCSKKSDGKGPGFLPPPGSNSTPSPVTFEINPVPTNPIYARIEYTWSSVEGADHYAILTSNGANPLVQLVGNLTSLSYNQINYLTQYTTLNAVLVAYDAGGSEIFRSPTKSFKPLPTTAPPSFSFDLSGRVHSVSANVRGADFYFIDYGTSPGNYTGVLSSNTTSITASTQTVMSLVVTPGETYYYRMRACNEVGGTLRCVTSSEISKVAYPPRPANVSAAWNPGETQVEISWDPSPGATGYHVIRSGVDLRHIEYGGATHPDSQIYNNPPPGFTVVAEKLTQSGTNHKIGYAVDLGVTTQTSITDSSLSASDSSTHYYYIVPVANTVQTPIWEQTPAIVTKAYNPFYKKDFSIDTLSGGDSLTPESSISGSQLELVSTNSTQTLSLGLGTGTTSFKDNFLLELITSGGVFPNGVELNASINSNTVSTYNQASLLTNGGSIKMGLDNDQQNNAIPDNLILEYLPPGPIGQTSQLNISNLILHKGIFKDFVHNPDSLSRSTTHYTQDFQSSSNNSGGNSIIFIDGGGLNLTADGASVGNSFDTFDYYQTIRMNEPVERIKTIEYEVEIDIPESDALNSVSIGIVGNTTSNSIYRYQNNPAMSVPGTVVIRGISTIKFQNTFELRLGFRVFDAKTIKIKRANFYYKN